MLMSKKEVKKEINGREYILKTPSPAQQPLFARIAESAGKSSRVDTQLLYTLAMLGLILKQPAINIDKPKRNEDGELSNLAVIEFGERVAEALDAQDIPLEDLFQLTDVIRELM